MKRINMFVLLCMVVFMSSGVAWSDVETPIIAPLVSGDSAGSVVRSSDVGVETHTEGNGTADSPYTIYIRNVNTIEEHGNPIGTMARWVGVAIKSKDKAVYIQGWDDIPAITDETEWVTDWDGIFESGSDKYSSLYWGVGDTPKNGYFVVSSDTGVTYYKIVFSAYTEPPAATQETPTEETEEEEEPSGAAKNDAVLDNLADDYGKETVDEAKQALEDAGITDELSEYELGKFLENLNEIKEAEAQEEASGQVDNPKVPAATNLPVEDTTLNTLSVQPKVVEPDTPEPEVKAAAESFVASLGDGGQVLDITDTNAIEIDNVSPSLAEQASVINKLFDAIKEFLTTAIEDAVNGVTIATSMPTMTVKTPGYFPMKMNMRHLIPGQKPRFWASTDAFKAKAGRTASVAAENGDCFFLDEFGNKTEVISGDASKMTVVPYLEGGTYDSAFITVDASAKDKKALEGVLTEEEKPEEPTTANSSSGGCEIGLGLGALFSLAVLIAFKKR